MTLHLQSVKLNETAVDLAVHKNGPAGVKIGQGNFARIVQQPLPDGGYNYRVSFNRDVVTVPSFNAPSMKDALGHVAHALSSWTHQDVAIQSHLGFGSVLASGPWVHPELGVPCSPMTMSSDMAALLPGIPEVAPVDSTPKAAKPVMPTVEAAKPSVTKPLTGQAKAVKELEEPSAPVTMDGGYDSHFKYKKGHKMSTFEAMAEAAIHGAKVGAADEAGNAVLGIGEALMGDMYPELAKTERGRSLMKAFTALGLHFVATSYPDVVPQPEAIQQACKMIVEAASRDIIQPEIGKITPLITQLAAAGAAQLKS